MNKVSRENLKRLVAEHRLDDLIDDSSKLLTTYLLTKKDRRVSEVYDSLILVSGKLKSVRHQNLVGIIDLKDSTLESNKIGHSLLSIINEIPEIVFESQYTAAGYFDTSEKVENLIGENTQHNIVEYESPEEDKTSNEKGKPNTEQKLQKNKKHNRKINKTEEQVDKERENSLSDKNESAEVKTYSNSTASSDSIYKSKQSIASILYQILYCAIHSFLPGLVFMFTIWIGIDFFGFNTTNFKRYWLLTPFFIAFFGFFAYKWKEYDK